MPDESAAHLDAHLPLVRRYDENSAIVRALLPDPPGAPELISIVLYGIALQGIGRVNHKLVAGFVLERLEVAFDCGLVSRGEQMRIVDDTPCERRKFGFGLTGIRDE